MLDDTLDGGAAHAGERRGQAAGARFADIEERFVHGRLVSRPAIA